MSDQNLKDYLLLASEIIAKWEGFSPGPYLCPANVWTIGYGSTRTPDGHRITPESPDINEELAMNWLYHHVQEFAAGVHRCVKVSLKEHQAAALISFAYNLGVGALQSSTLLRKLNRGDYDGAADEFPKWCFAGGRKLKGLYNRRMDERDLFLSP